MDETLINEIYEYCRRLRLSKAFADRAIERSGEMENLSFLRALLKMETELRGVKRVEKWIEAAGFPCRFDEKDFDASEVSFPPGMTFQSLMDLHFWDGEKPQNVVLYGGAGVGKTTLSSGLGRKAAAGGCQTAYCNTQSLVEDLVDAQERGALRAFLKRYEKVRVLILDDFGYVPISLEGSRLLFRLLTPFFGRKTIILNTNIKFSQWPDVIPEEGLAATIAGRLMDGAILLKLHGRDRRFDAHRAGQ